MEYRWEVTGRNTLEAAKLEALYPVFVMAFPPTISQGPLSLILLTICFFFSPKPPGPMQWGQNCVLGWEEGLNAHLRVQCPCLSPFSVNEHLKLQVQQKLYIFICSFTCLFVCYLLIFESRNGWSIEGGSCLSWKIVLSRASVTGKGECRLHNMLM